MAPTETIENGAEMIENDAETIENGAETTENNAETTENGAETKHLNSTRTARPPKGPGSSSRIQMLKSSLCINWWQNPRVP